MIDIIRRMDFSKMENRLVLQCAPFLVGLKTASLFRIRTAYLPEIRELLKGSTLTYFTLYEEKEMSMIFLYHAGRLEACLKKKPVRRILFHAGYPAWNPGEVLPVFRHRYRKYRCGGGEFPHELGLLLGYPAEDVEGFIRNGGENFLYTGYWKVYHNVPEKKELFRMYELARETLIQLVCNGIGLAEIIDVYSDNTAAL